MENVFLEPSGNAGKGGQAGDSEESGLQSPTAWSPNLALVLVSGNCSHVYVGIIASPDLEGDVRNILNNPLETCGVAHGL